MRATRFDALFRTLATVASRRQIVAAIIFGGGLPLLAMTGAAGPGCKNVSRKCKRAKQCCSGVCQGKTGKKTCRAHDIGGCEAGTSTNLCGGSNVSCTTSTGVSGQCETTTGHAGYCRNGGVWCKPCRKDADCRSVCGAAAACIRCPAACGAMETVCVGLTGCET